MLSAVVSVIFWISEFVAFSCAEIAVGLNDIIIANIIINGIIGEKFFLLPPIET